MSLVSLLLYVGFHLFVWFLEHHAMHPAAPIPLPPDVSAAVAKIGVAADKIGVFVDQAASDAFYGGCYAGGLGGLVAGVLVGLILAGLFMRSPGK